MVVVGWVNLAMEVEGIPEVVVVDGTITSVVRLIDKVVSVAWLWLMAKGVMAGGPSVEVHPLAEVVV